MNRFIKYTIYVVLFFIVGELLVRFNRSFDLLNHSPEIIEVKMEASPLKVALDESMFEIKNDQLRIMVLGDSYINGGGIYPLD